MDGTNSYEDSVILTKAVICAVDLLDIDMEKLSELMTLDQSVIDEMAKGKQLLMPDEKQWEIGLMIVILFDSLTVIVGEDDAARRHWMATDNRHLGSAPINLIKTFEGLERTVNYLQVFR